jgi:RNA polymerase sigma-70 factor (ECF subfamily)
MQSDEEITAQVKNGDAQAFGLLAERYKNRLYSFILYSVKDAGAAGDIFQDTLLKAFLGINGYNEAGKFKAWLFTIARNKIMDYYRDAAKTVQFGEKDDADTYATPDDNTETKALGAITLAEIRNFIGCLPAEQREVVIMRTYLSFKEIAAVLGCPLGTVLARMNRGVKKLRQFMGEDYAS